MTPKKKKKKKNLNIMAEIEQRKSHGRTSVIIVKDGVIAKIAPKDACHPSPHPQNKPHVFYRRPGQKSITEKFTDSNSSVRMVSVLSEKPICSPSRLPEVSPTLPLKQFQCTSDWRCPLSFFQRKSSSACSFYASLLQAIDDEMSLVLCLWVISQAP